MPRGGHFPALECPDDLAADIRTFFRTIGWMKSYAGFWPEGYATLQ
jgi:hypothetical protein